MSDFDFEPVRGLPETLPQGERMVWQGAPRWQDLAVHAFHARKAVIYFAVLGAVQAVSHVSSGGTLEGAAKSSLWFLILAGAAALLLTGLAYFSARTTVYTLTSKRLVMRFGIALPMTINLPFKLIDSASVKIYANGSGDIPLKVAKGNRLAYLVLWPHAKRWEYSNPQPALRCVPNADNVAALVAAALTSQPLPRIRPLAQETGKTFGGAPAAAH
jgi:hypothetical protein